MISAPGLTLADAFTGYAPWLDRQLLTRNTCLTLSARMLRHTCLRVLVRTGTERVRVADIAGHARLGTTLRYHVPNAGDGEAAMEGLCLAE